MTLSTKGATAVELTDLHFLLRFLPLFLLVYYLCPNRYRNRVLLVGSLIFYSFYRLQDTVLLLFTVTVNYVLIGLMERKRNAPIYRKSCFLLVLLYNVGVLCFYKYLASSLPLGISFYTFTLLSYAIDVYRQKAKPTRSWLELGAFAAMFPKILSGPITPYRDMIGQIRNRKVNAKQAEYGLSLLIVGLSFKVIIADHLGILWHEIQKIGFESISTPLAWMGVVGYSVQLLYDFQGYSLMAMGLAAMLGFRILPNFNHPYRSRSIGEFYRRWHISLGNWFREYLYIPLGGNRKGTARTVLNLLIVWAVTGIWHGVTVNFLLWGLVLGLLIVSEKCLIGDFLKRHKLFSRCYVLCLIPMTWVVFAITDLKQLGVYFSRLFPFWETENVIDGTDFLRYGKIYFWFFLIAFIVSFPIANRLWAKYWNRTMAKAVLFVLFWVCIYQISNGQHNPFLYFSF